MKLLDRLKSSPPHWTSPKRTIALVQSLPPKYVTKLETEMCYNTDAMLVRVEYMVPSSFLAESKFPP